MENLLFIVEFIGALIIFFYLAGIVGQFLKLDDYMRKHQTNYQKKTHG